MMGRCTSCLAALATLALGAPSPAAGQTGATHLLVVTGAGGEPQYREAFHAMGAKLVEAARAAGALPASNVVFLAEDSARAPATGRSSKAGVERALSAIASRAAAQDRVVIVLIGHGSQQREHARFNLPGPDVTASEMAVMLERFGARTVAVVNAASASGDWVKALSRKNRVVITATRGAEANATVFPRFFVDALSGAAADTDKDGRVSLLEAYDYARRETARAYESDNRLLSEHAQLDDDGDGKGTGEAGVRVATGASAGGSDGALARRVFLSAGSAAAAAVAADDPRSAALAARRDSLQSAVETLRARKASMSAAAYDAELERLLVALATVNRELRSSAGAAP